MKHSLTPDELAQLVTQVFSPTERDHRLAILVDLPDAQVPDNPDWKARREIATDWAAKLAPLAGEMGLDAVRLVAYRNAHANNADLPATGTYCEPDALPPTAEALNGDTEPFDTIFQVHQLFIALTEFSATAPLKMAAPYHGFRAATMPGFARSMLPSLKLDYTKIGQRVDRLKGILDQAQRCDLEFVAEGTAHRLTLDLRHRTAHASGGRFPDRGIAGNLPSGESYIVPYEGENQGDPTQSAGVLPVQFGEDVVLYKIDDNRAHTILSDNPASELERKKLTAEPAYGNIAELGLGVLGDFGLEPTGEILLDEKLGLHIAFGRSEHFGGQTGPDAFSSSDKVVHIDYVYLPSLQPKIVVKQATLTMGDGTIQLLMKDGQYQIDFE